MGGQGGVDRHSGIDRVVGRIDERLTDLAHSGLGASVTTRSKVRVVIKGTGARRRTARLLAALGEVLGRAGIFFDPELLDAGTSWNKIIRFSRKPLDPAEVDKELFASEHGMEEYLEHNLARIDGLEDLTPYKTQFALPNDRFIDLLCRDQATGGWAVVELKRDRPTEGVVAQTIDYVKTLRSSDFANGAPVRGVIITGTDDDHLVHQALVHATADYIDLRWYVYDTKVTVTNIAATPAPPIKPSPKPAPDADHRPPGPYDDRHVTADNPWRG